MKTMKFLFCLILVCGTLVSVATPSPRGTPKNSQKILEEEYRSVTFVDGQMTTARRGDPYPQMSCVEGDQTRRPKSAVCDNKGKDRYGRVIWECKYDAPECDIYDVEVICEGYDSPYDPYVLVGSCALEYRLRCRPIPKPYVSPETKYNQVQPTPTIFEPCDPYEYCDGTDPICPSDRPSSERKAVSFYDLKEMEEVKRKSDSFYALKKMEELKRKKQDGSQKSFKEGEQCRIGHGICDEEQQEKREPQESFFSKYKIPIITTLVFGFVYWVVFIKCTQEQPEEELPQEEKSDDPSEEEEEESDKKKKKATITRTTTINGKTTTTTHTFGDNNKNALYPEPSAPPAENPERKSKPKQNLSTSSSQTGSTTFEGPRYATTSVTNVVYNNPRPIVVTQTPEPKRESSSWFGSWSVGSTATPEKEKASSSSWGSSSWSTPSSSSWGGSSRISTSSSQSASAVSSRRSSSSEGTATATSRRR